MTVYNDYSRARFGLFLGLGPGQLTVVTLSLLPVVAAMAGGRWGSAFLLLLIWLVVLFLVAVPVLGRPATGWMMASSAFAAGRLMRWSSWRSRAATGRSTSPGVPDLPGILQGVEVHEGPPTGASLERVAIIQDHGAKTWAMTARVTHPGIGLKEASERDAYAQGLTALLDQCSMGELVETVIFLVRTVPEDGAERDHWVQVHRREHAPASAREVNDALQATLTRASVRTEAFVTIVVPETRLARVSRQSGGGLDGRARVLYSTAAEVEAQLMGGMGMQMVRWLTSEELAVACRSGFAPGDRAGIIDALSAQGYDPSVNASVPWGLAGPSGADATARHYSHDAWNSVSATVVLPVRGAALGALAPILAPSEPGERRTLMVAYPIMSRRAAVRKATSNEFQADVSDGLNEKLGRRTSTASQTHKDRVRRLEGKVAGGNALVRPYAVATVTVPKTVRVSEFGRRLDASIRRSGFAPLRMDIAHDVAFAASTVPLGVDLSRAGD